MAHDVFISHSTKDKIVADAVCAMLEQHGDITPVETPGINDAIANLRTALANAPAPKTQTPGAQTPAHPAAPPGHGGQPPGQAKHARPHGH